MPSRTSRPHSPPAARYTSFGTVLVDVVVALHLRRDPRANWRRLHRRAVAQTLALYVLGALGALLVQVEPSALVFLVLPIALIHVSLNEVSRLRERTRAAIFELADLLDERDPYTHGHSQRVADYAERVALHMRLSPAQVDLVRESGRLHDLGKIGTPVEVLHKPTALAGHELVAMRAHPEYGARILAKLPDFWEGAAIVAAHHERKDGRGYPAACAATRYRSKSRSSRSPMPTTPWPPTDRTDPRSRGLRYVVSWRLPAVAHSGTRRWSLRSLTRWRQSRS